VVKPDRRGFGSVMIERSIPADLGGEAEIAFLPEGVHARFLLPAECVSEAEPGEPAAAASQAAEGSAPMPGHVLLAEDNLIIALDTEEMLLGFGVQSVQVVSTVAAALAALDERRPDFALLDVNLGDAMSFAVAERLRALGIRFAFATGYSEPEALPESLRDVPQLRKPFSLDSLRRILASPA
jgi:CheY-like chemotaxis protein